ncbi:MULTISPECIES: nucleotide exchange factor GrpE [Paenibacillus]|uniref:Protein GrpE n=1 Tax=Paenibacillus violae TaxID=3077234 RepID=A0ABU3RDQ1_9BACL|nr:MULTISPECIES: nucleotide exchange factor GrpE [Paenibacillus]MDU0202218.1 nucleotide exchange factor GrpE [Paenibacillus sp. PFR10]MEC0271036.1 nucleotide exchange factor GrpE [Paenibacillus anseongense]
MSTDNKTEEQDVNTTYATDNEQTAENQEDAAAQDTQAEASAEASELEKVRVQAEENYQRLLRVQADFDNFRRRARAEKEDFAKYASLKLIEQLLPIVDNFDRALASSKETKDFDALAKGLEMTYRGMDQLLTAEGLKPIEAVGQPFNPEFHQAVMQVESDEYEEGIVVEELQKGYILKDKVIRPAMVKVSV